MRKNNIIRRDELLNNVHSKLKNNRKMSRIKKSELNIIYNTLVDEIVVQLESGCNVHLTKFMSFEILERQSYWGCNPRTGEMMDIPHKRKVRLRPMVRLMNAAEKDK